MEPRSGLLSRFAFVTFALSSLGCGEASHLRSDPPIESLTAELVPAVEKAVGLKFKRPPGIAARSREQVKTYLLHKLDTDMPPDEIRGVTLAYQLFGLIPDSLDLRALLVDLYTEQVVGYYDPDSSMLYLVQGTDPTQARMVLAHELVHALQGQYLSLDSLLNQPHQNDRRMAAQAVMEGQATIASFAALMPDPAYDTVPDFWSRVRQSVRSQQASMPVFRSAPLIIQEDLIFPYWAGADFVSWFQRSHPDTVPFGSRLPRSTEQVLHPDRYREDDEPVSLAFPAAPDVIYQDGLGEFETGVLLTQLTGDESVGVAGALGWAGDRYAILAADQGDALVWWTLWDTQEAGQRFARLLEREWSARARPDRRAQVTEGLVGARAAVRFVDAPPGWAGWRKLPEVEVR